MNTIRDREEALFREWRARRPDLVADGVVDEASYLASTPRLMLVLKEVNDPNGGGWDLRKFLQKGGRRQTWDVVTRWLIALRSPEREIPWAEVQHVRASDRIDALRSIAAVNLKKSPGGHTAVSDLITQAATDDADLLERQIGLYEADIVVCCGTWSDFRSFRPEADASPVLRTARGIRYSGVGPGRFVIDYMHPNARCAAPLIHYGLIDAVREIQGQHLRYTGLAAA